MVFVALQLSVKSDSLVTHRKPHSCLPRSAAQQAGLPLMIVHSSKLMFICCWASAGGDAIAYQQLQAAAVILHVACSCQRAVAKLPEPSEREYHFEYVVDGHGVRSSLA